MTALDRIEQVATLWHPEGPPTALADSLLAIAHYRRLLSDAEHRLAEALLALKCAEQGDL